MRDGIGSLSSFDVFTVALRRLFFDGFISLRAMNLTHQKRGIWRVSEQRFRIVIQIFSLRQLLTESLKVVLNSL